MASYNSNISNYNQVVIQNSNPAGNASNSFVASNNAATSASNFGEFGINSTSYTGTGSFSLPGAVYMAAATTDLAVGTYSNNPIHFVVNSGNTDAMTILSGGSVVISSGLSANAVSASSITLNNLSINPQRTNFYWNSIVNGSPTTCLLYTSPSPRD